MSELQHPDARSFEQVADQYERTRPTYPDDAVEWLAERLGIAPGTRVVDLGAGTGKLTRSWVERGAHVTAVEPGREMLARLERALPEVEVVPAGAESIPLEDTSVDAVTCGQSFHWFRAHEALTEIARILKPGGGLGLIWNSRDQEDELQRELTELIAPLVPPGRKGVGRSTEVVDADPRFTDVERYVTWFAHMLDADGLVDRLGSTSFVAAAGESERRGFADAVRAAVAERGGRVRFRYVTEVYLTFLA